MADACQGRVTPVPPVTGILNRYRIPRICFRWKRVSRVARVSPNWLIPGLTWLVQGPQPSPVAAGPVAPLREAHSAKVGVELRYTEGVPAAVVTPPLVGAVQRPTVGSRGDLLLALLGHEPPDRVQPLAVALSG